MEAFGRASFSQGGFGRVQIRPSVGQPHLGQATKPTQRQVIERMRSTMNRFQDIAARNADIPLEYRVTGVFQNQLHSIADQMWMKWIMPLDQRPSAPYWNDPATQQMLSDADYFDAQVATLEQQVNDAAMKAGTPAPGTPGAAPEAGPAVSKAGMLPPSSMLVLGLLAVGTFVGAALLGSDHSGFFMAGRRR